MFRDQKDHGENLVPWKRDVGFRMSPAEMLVNAVLDELIRNALEEIRRLFLVLLLF